MKMKALDGKMHSRITDKRIEIKNLCPLSSLHLVEAALLQSPLGFREAYSPRRINSLYFDTPDFKSVSESFSGASIRAKHRFRWYGETSEARNPTYEIKCKNGHLSWKHLTTLEFTIQTSAKIGTPLYLIIVGQIYRESYHSPVPDRFQSYLTTEGITKAQTIGLGLPWTMKSAISIKTFIPDRISSLAVVAPKN